MRHLVFVLVLVVSISVDSTGVAMAAGDALTDVPLAHSPASLSTSVTVLAAAGAVPSATAWLPGQPAARDAQALSTPDSTTKFDKKSKPSTGKKKKGKKKKPKAPKKKQPIDLPD